MADGLALELLGVRAERVTADGRVRLRWRFGTAPLVLLVGHLDTVWPLGTLARWPFAVDGGIGHGPRGVRHEGRASCSCSMRLAALGVPEGVAVLLTTDEEIGSPTSRPLIEETVAGVESRARARAQRATDR